jgi:hypothetical protein
MGTVVAISRVFGSDAKVVIIGSSKSRNPMESMREIQ